MTRSITSYDIAFLSGRRGRVGAADVYAGLRDAILQGRLPVNARLPSTRQLALDYGVSRGTVVSAYEQLLAEGYLNAQQGSGTRVNAVTRETQSVRATTTGRRNTDVRTEPVALSGRGKALSKSPFGAVGAGAGVPFAPQMPALQEFPLKLWASIAARQARSLSPQMLGDADPRGQNALRTAIAEYLGGTRGVHCTPEQVIVLASVQQAVDLAARLLLEEGDDVWFEDPGYPGALSAFRAAGVVPRGVRVDDKGMDVQHALSRWPRARMAYVTPAHQAPLGMALSLQRRLALIAWAQRNRSWIFEDDYDSEYRYGDKPLPALQSLDPRAPVLYAGCFSKTLFPGLRIAYLVVPHGLVDATCAARSSTSRYSPVLDQVVLAEFMRGGHYARHLRRMRQLYGERRELFLQLLRSNLAGKLEPLDNPTGLNIACVLGGGAKESLVVSKCHEAGLLVQALSSFSISDTRRTPAGMLLGFASLPAPTLRTAVPKLAKALELAAIEQRAGSHQVPE